MGSAEPIGGAVSISVACNVRQRVDMETHMAPEARTELFNIRVSPTELSMLRAIADADGLSAADVVRTLVRREYAARFGQKAPKKPKAK